MAAFSDPAFDDHERVMFCRDAATGLKAIIAIHSTALGPAAGGCRLWNYPTDDAALHDVLRLSQGMSYKNAMAGLKFGGGKAVIMKTPDFSGSDALYEKFGDFVQQLNGSYVTAEDVGMSVRNHGNDRAAYAVCLRAATEGGPCRWRSVAENSFRHIQGH